LLTGSESAEAKALMRPYALLYMYRRRLRVHAIPELLAGLGVAIAVALVFAVTVANESVVGSASQVVHAVIGPANLQLRARSPDGFDEHLLSRVEHLAYVEQAAPVLEQSVTLLGPHGKHVTVELAGADVSLTILDGLAHTVPRETLSPGGIGLSKESAQALGVGSSRTSEVTLQLRGTAHRLKVSAVLGAEAAGVLSRAFLATMSLENLQRLAGLRERISRIFIETDPGHEASVRSELGALAQGRLTVAKADEDVALLRQALRPTNLATGFFAAISALLGFLFAFNAMLLTAPERRQVMADLRLSGTRRTAIVQMVLFQALCLGLGASLVGLLVGYALSLGFFHQTPGYLAEAFTLGGSTVIGVLPVLASLFIGVLAACLASAVPLLDLRRGRALDAVYLEDGVPGNMLGRRAPRTLALIAAGLLVLASAMFALLPAVALGTCVVLALATVLAIPLIFGGVLSTAGAVAANSQRLTILPVALTSLRATTLRSLALAATGALALFGSVALGGASGDLLRGIEGYIHGYVSGARIWVVNPHDPTAVEPLPSSYAARVGAIAGVSKVSAFQSSYLDIGQRRVWVIARPSGTSEAVLNGQIVDGNLATAARHIDEGGWISVSSQIAAERHVGLGRTLILPTPDGNLPFRIAATTTNLTWSPGAILMNSADYSRAWGSLEPTALGVDLRPGTSVSEALQKIEPSLGPTSAVEALTPETRTARTSAVGREGLSKLNEISTLLLIAAITAIAAALSSAIWQRRPSLAALRLSGVEPRRLRRILLMEAALMLVGPCLTGALAGIYGQLILDGYLKTVTGFPVAGLSASWRPLEIFALVSAAVLIVVMIPGWLASRVSPALALAGE
jgi:putative ABC transport system permease protein